MNITVSLSEAEYSDLTKRAEQGEQTPAEYLRACYRAYLSLRIKSDEQSDLSELDEINRALQESIDDFDELLQASEL